MNPVRIARRALPALAALIALLVPAVLAPAADPPRVTVIGDSVQASFGFAPQAVRHLRPGLRLRVEADVCRRLSSPGCLGGSPASAVALADALGPSLGDVVVVNVGYNDDAARYDVGAAMAAFRRAGVRAVVWVTLREARGRYAATNALIRAAARRAARRGDLPVVRVADWNALGAGRPWFASDRLHLNGAGALGLATLLREEVLAALADVGVSVDGRPVTVRIDRIRLGVAARRIAGAGDLLWWEAGGRIAALAERTGRRAAAPLRLAPGEDLAGDGVAAWLRDPAARTLTAAPDGTGERRRLAGIGPRPLLARAGGRLWAAPACAAAGCADGRPLTGVRLATGARREATVTGGRVTALAGDARALWALVREPGGGARLERRDPRTGALRRATPLPRSAVRLAAGARRAWVVTRNRQLLAVGADGRARRVASGVRAVAATGPQLWALRADARTVVRLDPRTGRVRSRSVAPRRLADAMAFTDRHLWILAASRGEVVRIARG